jgi:hypothetical protein
MGSSKANSHPQEISLHGSAAVSALVCALLVPEVQLVPLFQLLQTRSWSRPKAGDRLNLYQRCQNESLLIRTGLIGGSQRRGGQSLLRRAYVLFTPLFVR